MSKVADVLSVLTEGPATSFEVAAELGWDVRIASAHLSNLRRSRRVVSERAQIKTGGRPAQLWRIRGEAA
jgi:predicted ArsR family transcriptional regulator